MPQESHFHPKAPPTLSHFLCAHCSVERRSLLQVACRLRSRLHSAQVFASNATLLLQFGFLFTWQLETQTLRTGSRVKSYLLIMQNPCRLRKPAEFSDSMARFSSAHYVQSNSHSWRRLQEGDHKRQWLISELCLCLWLWVYQCFSIKM